MSNQALLSAVSQTSDKIFAVVLVVLVALLGILIIVAAVRSSSARKSGGAKAAGTGGGGRTAPAKIPVPKEKKPVLMGSLARDDGGEERTEPPVIRDKTSIDKGYADKHGMWVCGYCEVLNDDSLRICQACGNPRSR